MARSKVHRGVGQGASGNGSALATYKYLQDDERIISGDKAADYYDGFKDTWGSLSRTLGLEQGITKDQWVELHGNSWEGEQLVTVRGSRQVIDHDTGEILGRELVTNPGIDIVFAAPKSVSELYARAATQEQADAIGQAVMKAAKLGWEEGVQNYAKVVRVTKKSAEAPTAAPGAQILDEVEEAAKRAEKKRRNPQEYVTADLLCTPVLQHTARPTDATEARGAPADPHLHVHAWTFAYAQVDGKWYTANDIGLKKAWEYRENLFQMELARQMELLGYEMDYKAPEFDAEGELVKSTRKGWVRFEAKASIKKLRDHLSSNHERAILLRNEFEAEFERTPTDAELNALMDRTRGKKADKEMDAHPTRERWWADWERSGFVVPKVNTMLQKMRSEEARKEDLVRRLLSEQGLVRGDSTFTGDSIRPAMVRCAVGLGFSFDELVEFEKEFSDELICVRQTATDANSLYTTKAHAQTELENREWRNKKAHEEHQAVPEELFRAIAAQQEFPLSDEQIEAGLEATAGTGLHLVLGYAGAGKSVTIKTIGESLEAAGLQDQMIVLSTSGKIGVETALKVGATDGGSVESMYRATQRRGKNRLVINERTTIVVDEAAMLDTHRLAKIRKMSNGARIVFVGDPAQISPIGPAGFFAEHMNTHGYSMLTEVHRHRNPLDVADYNLLREAKGAEAVRNLDQRGKISVTRDAASRLGAIMQDYRSLLAEGYKTSEIVQVVGSNNKDVDQLNDFIQRERLRRGELGENMIRVHDEEQDRRWNLYENDRVMFLRSVKDLSGEAVRNGCMGNIKTLNPQTGRTKVVLDDGRTVEVKLKARELQQVLGRGDAVFDLKFQGGQAKQVQIIPGSMEQATANKAYSQLTRGEHDAKVYVSADDFAPQQTEHEQHHRQYSVGVTPVSREAALEGLARSWSRHEIKETALSVLEDELGLDIMPGSAEGLGISLEEIGRRRKRYV